MSFPNIFAVVGFRQNSITIFLISYYSVQIFQDCPSWSHGSSPELFAMHIDQISRFLSAAMSKHGILLTGTYPGFKHLGEGRGDFQSRKNKIFEDKFLSESHSY